MSLFDISETKSANIWNGQIRIQEEEEEKKTSMKLQEKWPTNNKKETSKQNIEICKQKTMHSGMFLLKNHL